MRELSSFATGDLVPDLVLYLDVAPDVGLSRLSGRKGTATRFEKEKLEFHTRVRNGYLEGLSYYPHTVVVDGARDIELVHKDVLAAVNGAIGE